MMRSQQIKQMGPWTTLVAMIHLLAYALPAMAIGGQLAVNVIDVGR